MNTTQCLISRVDKLFMEWNEIHNLVTKQSFWEGGEYFHCPIGIITRWIIPNLVIIRRFIIAKILRTNASSNGGRRITLRPLQLAKRGYLDRLGPLAKLKRGGKTLPNNTWTKTIFCIKVTKWVSRDAPGQTFLRGGFLPSVHETSFIGLTSGTLGRIEPVKIITSGGVFVEQTSTWVA